VALQRNKALLMAAPSMVFSISPFQEYLNTGLLSSFYSESLPMGGLAEKQSPFDGCAINGLFHFSAFASELAR
jgi:hypothetical protein